MNLRLMIFASGTKDGGGSGFENLVAASKSGILDAEIVAVVSNHERGGVRERADRLGVRFIYFPCPYDAENYQRVIKEVMVENSLPRSELRSTTGDWIALSGWLKQVKGIDPRRTFNIHPALLSYDHGRFGGSGMYGHRLQEAVKSALDAGEVTESGFTMHFVTDEFDRGPAFFEFHVPLKKGMSADEIAKAVNVAEHEWQPKITNMVVHGEISWDGKNPGSLVVPVGYQYLPKR